MARVLAHKGNTILPRSMILQRNLVVIPCGKILARSPFSLFSSFDSPALPPRVPPHRMKRVIDSLEIRFL